MSGHHLKKLRMANGLSQTYVAKELHIDRAKVSRWENDIILPSDEELKALSKLYSVDIKTLKSRLNKIDIETSLEGSESLIAEKLDELHLSVSNELNAAIANQKESIRQQGEQIEMQKETLNIFSEKIEDHSKLQEDYIAELNKNREEYAKSLRMILCVVISSIILLALLVFGILLALNYRSNNHEYDTVVTAIEISEKEVLQ